MSYDDVIEQEPDPENPQTALVAAPAAGTPVDHAQIARAKSGAVSEALKNAYARAGTLQLTDEEANALIAEFPDSAFRKGAAGKESLIYIEHADLRDRLTSVLGLGQWTLLTVRTWEEEFEMPGKSNQPPVQGVKIYCEAALVVRGCFVGNAIGDMDYYPHNNSTNYGDAFEGAKTAAFRRCAKEFGVGLQAWRKNWCEGWWQRTNGNPHQGGQQRPHPTTTAAPYAGNRSPAASAPASSHPPAGPALNAASPPSAGSAGSASGSPSQFAKAPCPACHQVEFVRKTPGTNAYYCWKNPAKNMLGCGAKWTGNADRQANEPPPDQELVNSFEGEIQNCERIEDLQSTWNAILHRKNDFTPQGYQFLAKEKDARKKLLDQIGDRAVNEDIPF